MAKDVEITDNTSNLESNTGVKYKITFGNFEENEKGEVNFPPQNAKSYEGLEEILALYEMDIKAESHENILDDNGNIVARVSNDGKVLTGKLPKEKATKKSNKEDNIKE